MKDAVKVATVHRTLALALLFSAALFSSGTGAATAQSQMDRCACDARLANRPTDPVPGDLGYKIRFSTDDLVDGECDEDECTPRECYFKFGLKIIYSDGSAIECPKLPNGEIDFGESSNPMYSDCFLWHGDSADEECPKWENGMGQPLAEPEPGSSESEIEKTLACGEQGARAYKVKACDGSITIGVVVDWFCLDCDAAGRGGGGGRGR